MKKKMRIGIIFGGRSVEHDISVISANSVMSAIDKSKYDVVPIAIDREGKWLSSGVAARLLKAGDNGLASLAKVDKTNTLEVTTTRLPSSTVQEVDVVFPILHGSYGEDGTLQGLLEMAGIPYVGAGVLASAIGMDKALMKTVFRQNGLPVSDFLPVLRSRWESSREEILKQIEGRFRYPCFVKPANSGSSIGISKAHHRQELISSMDEAALYDRKIVVEEFIDAREIECSVLGNDEPIASVLGEIVPKSEFYSFDAKYVDEKTELVIPADLTTQKSEQIKDLAIGAFKAIDCDGMARVDFFLEKQSGDVFVNEINTIPGFTQISMYPRLWEASGIGYRELIDRLIELAVERNEDKRRNRLTPI